MELLYLGGFGGGGGINVPTSMPLKPRAGLNEGGGHTTAGSRPLWEEEAETGSGTGRGRRGPSQAKMRLKMSADE